MKETGIHDVRTVVAAGDTVVDLLAGALNRAQLEAHPHDWVLDSVAELPTMI